MTSYNRIAGQSLERLAALSDGFFSIGMTLLVLDLRVPLLELGNIPAGSPDAEALLLQNLVKIAPSFVAYLMSFLTLGIFWLGQQTQFNMIARSDRAFSWIHLAFMLAISLMPFSTRLLAEYIVYRTALIVYWFNIFILGAILFISWSYAQSAGLLKPETTAPMRVAAERRIINYQLLYGVGALLCIVNTYVSIGFIVLVQLNAALAVTQRLRLEK